MVRKNQSLLGVETPRCRNTEAGFLMEKANVDYRVH